MTFRQKRSSGGYGLRRKVVKKKLDDDFEYNFSKVGSGTSTKLQSTQLATLVMVGTNNHKNDNLDVVQSNKIEEKCDEHSMKRQRGRPRKAQIVTEIEVVKITDSSLKLIKFQDQKVKKPRILYVEPPTNSLYTTVGEVCGVNEDISMSVSHEEVVENSVDVVWKKIKNCAEGTEEEVTSSVDRKTNLLPKVEKENLPDHRINVGDMQIEDGIIMELNLHNSNADSEDEVSCEDIVEASKKVSKRKYRKKFEDHMEGLQHLSPDQKIECSECHKLLKPSSYRQHLRTHTGEKPFCCDVCDARFTRKGDVERHVRIVHNKQKPFKCGRCQRAFGDKKNLRWHLMNHDKKLFYICDNCGFKFGKREYWENHVRFIHPLPSGLDPSYVKVGCDEDEYLQLNAPETIEDEEEDAYTQDDPSEDGVILSVQDNDDPPKMMKNLPPNCQIIKQYPHKYANIKGLNVCNYIHVKEVQAGKHGDDTESVVIEFSELDSSNNDTAVEHLPLVTHVDVMNPTNIPVLHVLQSNNTVRQPMPIIIETQDIHMTNAHESNDDGTEKEKEGQVISIILNDHESVVGDNNSSVHSFIDSLIDVDGH